MREAALAVAVTLVAGAAVAQDYGKILYAFSIRDGETLALRRITSTSNNCEPIFIKVEGIDVMEGPSELSFTSELAQVHTSVTGKDCPKAVPGAVIKVTAKGVTEQKETPITLRVRMETTHGPWQNTIRSRILMFPAGKHDQATETSKQ